MNTEPTNTNGFNKVILLVVIIIVIAGILSNIYLWNREVEPQQQDQTVTETSEDTSDDFLNLRGDIEEPTIQYPVPEESVPVEDLEAESVEETSHEDTVLKKEPLPALDESDESVKQSLLEISGSLRLEELFIFDSFIRHFVVTIDNMTGKKLPQRYVFTAKPADKFSVIKQVETEEIWLDEKNFNRYNAFINLAQKIDMKQAVKFYVRFYPLFQQAYQDLGYPGHYFNDRLIKVIDHVLLTPEVQGPIKLIQPKVFYVFSDQTLENLSAGQKILIRIGPQNAQIVRTKLKELRQYLTNLGKR